MSKTKKYPFKNLVIDKYEKEIEDALEKGNFTSDKNLKETKKMFEEAAKNYIQLQKTKPITLRVNTGDLIKVKVKAKKGNIPYQTLLSSLIHKYAEGLTKIEI